MLTYSIHHYKVTMRWYAIMDIIKVFTCNAEKYCTLKGLWQEKPLPKKWDYIGFILAI